MKKSLLLLLSIGISVTAIAQVEYFPDGFRRAKVPAALNKTSLRPIRKAIDNQAPANSNAVTVALPGPVRAQSMVTEDIIGKSYYDLQTNNSISNRLVVSADGTISAAWTYSPNAVISPTLYPQRGSGYNYWNGTAFNYPLGPSTRQEAVRTGFTNIVVTETGKELLIAHNVVGTTDSNRIIVTTRPVKGTGTWTSSYPWGPGFDTWPKAVAGGEDSVYVIFQGSGAATTPHVEAGQNGPIFFSQSYDGGANWTPKWINPLIDSTHYSGFGGDSYSIDAKGSTIAISIGDTYTDVLLLKSTDHGQTWTKKIVQRHPIPFYATCNCGTFYIPDATDTVVDTVFSNAGDSKVMIDNNGMCHVWFSRWDYMDDDSTDDLYLPFDASDDLFYWNEEMDEDTIGGHRAYVSIATAQDFSGNGFIDVPSDTNIGCTARNPWGEYGGGITQMPSAGIDENGRIYLTYQTINELADTTLYHAAHRHVYMKTLIPDGGGHYDPVNWTNPYNIVPSIAQNGNGENEEAVFACTAKRVGACAYVLYQRDGPPGHALAADMTCDNVYNANQQSEQVLTCVSREEADGIKTTFTQGLFVGQNYPNPARSVTYINLGMKKAATVKIVVHDLVGQVVFEESEGLLQSGTNTIRLNIAGWEAGIYTYTVYAGGEKATRRMIVQ